MLYGTLFYENRFFLSSKQAKNLALMDEYAKYKFNYVEAC